MNKFLIVSHGGRESAFAARLSEDSPVYAFAGHANPSIEECCRRSGGRLAIGDVNDAQAIADFARECAVDYAFVNADGPLSKGAVDALRAGGVRAIGPTRQGSRIEWDKIFSIRVVEELFPQYCPRFRVVSKADEAADAVRELCADGGEAVIKPQGLTGGKGVKVMGEHLDGVDAAIAYTRELLDADPSAEALVVEKLDGVEFTLMGLTDGRTVVGAPVTYDYPYRLDGDRGPGTGGMGCFTDHNNPMSFLDPGEFDRCVEILGGVVERIGQMGAHFSGVLNGGFFLTAKGLRFMEFNARFGDPEGINILSVLKSPFSELLRAIHHGELAEDQLRFDDRASVVKYLVSPSYPASGPALKFRHSHEQFAEHNIDTFFASARALEGAGGYETVSSSRVLALSALGDSVEEAAQRINRAVDAYADLQLQFRADIGLADNLKILRERVARIHAAS